MGSCTEKVAHYAVDLPPDVSQGYKFGDGLNRRLILVDTPGFGHSTLGNEEVSRRIAVWLASSSVFRLFNQALGCLLTSSNDCRYGIGIKVAGVVYMHAIGGERMTASHTSGLDIFQKICGKDAFPMIVLAATRSNLCTQPDLMKREGHLRNELWKGMLDGGAAMHTLDNTADSAYDVVKTIFRRMSGPPAKLTVLWLQQQIVDEGRTYAKTSAGLMTAKQRAGFSLTKLVDMFRRFFGLSE
jgi:hypothetical protein